jgi:hypothetical protein
MCISVVVYSVSLAMPKNRNRTLGVEEKKRFLSMGGQRSKVLHYATHISARKRHN